MLFALEPDLIEVGDVFHPAWCAARVARARNIPLVAFFHSHLAQVLGRRFGAGVERAITRYVRHVYAQCDLVLAPSRLMCAYLAKLGVARSAYQPLGVDTECSRRRGACSICAACSSCRTMRGCWCLPGDSPRRRTCRCCARRWQCWANRITWC